ncbi:MAG: glycosyltransferase family 4 protein [Candidatus Eisenbacteria bacterium]
MNILVLNYEYPPLGGGAGVVTRALAELYVRRGHDVEVVTMGFPGLPAEETLNGVRIRRLQVGRKRRETCDTSEMILYVLRAFPTTLRKLRRDPVDVIHCHFVVPTGLLAYAATRRAKVPFVITAHGSDIPGYNPDRFTREHRFTPPLLRRIARSAARVTAPSRFLCDRIAENIPALDAVQIPNGIDRDLFDERPKERIILMSGRLLPRKGFYRVLEALRDTESDYEVHIAGDGPHRAVLEETAASLPMKVVFHGWLDHGSPEWKELYERSSVFCFPSQKENSPMGLLEAMLAGMAVITSDTSGCPEVIGDAGITVPPGDAVALGNALVELLGSDETARAYGRKARCRAREHFDWEGIGTRYLDLLAAASGRAGRV